MTSLVRMFTTFFPGNHFHGTQRHRAVAGERAHRVQRQLSSRRFGAEEKHLVQRSPRRRL